MALITMKSETDKVRQLLGRMRRLTPAIKEAFDKAALREMSNAMAEAQRTVPVEYGRLISSAFIRVKDKKNRSNYSIGYDAPYAIYVHEVPNSRRQANRVNYFRLVVAGVPVISKIYTGRTTRHTPGARNNGKGYKWLAKAIHKTWRGAAGRIARAIRPVIQKERRR